MCGRFVSPEEAMIARYVHFGRSSNPNPFARRFNVFPTDTIAKFAAGSTTRATIQSSRLGTATERTGPGGRALGVPRLSQLPAIAGLPNALCSKPVGIRIPDRSTRPEPEHQGEFAC
jgi:hypothetical protein